RTWTINTQSESELKNSLHMLSSGCHRTITTVAVAARLQTGCVCVFERARGNKPHRQSVGIVQPFSPHNSLLLSSSFSSVVTTRASGFLVTPNNQLHLLCVCISMSHLACINLHSQPLYCYHLISLKYHKLIPISYPRPPVVDDH